MAARSEQLLRHIRRLVSRPASSSDGDAMLLGRFVRQHDQDAFAALVRRHGPLVLSVCRHALGDAQLAEDPAQAAFLVLARKAAAIRPPDRLAAWLYGVAPSCLQRTPGRCASAASGDLLRPRCSKAFAS